MEGLASKGAGNRKPKKKKRKKKKKTCPRGKFQNAIGKT